MVRPGEPPDTENPEQFNYDQNATLTAETRKLFEYGKAFVSHNAISVFAVEHIEYYAEGSEVPTRARGLSFPPNNYHRPEDCPARNSVLLVPAYGAPGALPGALSQSALTHELGHMLLNSGDHASDPANLMSGFGIVLTTLGEQMLGSYESTARRPCAASIRSSRSSRPSQLFAKMASIADLHHHGRKPGDAPARRRQPRALSELSSIHLDAAAHNCRCTGYAGRRGSRIARPTPTALSATLIAARGSRTQTRLIMTAGRRTMVVRLGGCHAKALG